jgi:ubiquinone/menaquinone biosynthesis C-methylase UbiE
MGDSAEVNAVLRTGVEPPMIKSCCAVAYQSEWAKRLLGDSFHPGGLPLTEHLGQVLALDSRSRILDVAAGTGASAIHLAKTFGCQVVGIDYGGESVETARHAAQTAAVNHLVHFEQGDAEALPFDGEQFDAVLCECAFCTFPVKAAAAREFARMLRPGGHVGLTDLTRNGEMPPDLRGLLAWVACIADAQPLATYERHLQEAGLMVTLTEEHDDVLVQMVRDVRTRLLAAELLVKLKKVALPIADFDQAKAFAHSAAAAVRDGLFGYTLLVANKAGEKL